MNLKDNLIYSLDQMDKIIEELFLKLQECQIFAFSGDLGAGKTTIIKKFLKRCGIQEVITSPTYLYVNHYVNSIEQNFYHFDLYRIKNLEAFQNFGFHEILSKENSWIFIEWPEVIESLLNKKVCFIYLEYYNINERKLYCEVK